MLGDNLIKKGLFFHNKNNLPQAKFYYNSASKINPKNFNAFHLLSTIKIAYQNYETALYLINRAITINPTFYEAYCNRGVVNNFLGNTQEAINDFNESLRLNPRYALAYLNRGIAKRSLNLFSEAITDYNEAINLNPDYAEAYCYRARTYDLLNFHNEAIADYDQAIKLKPNYIEAYINKGYTTLSLGDFKHWWNLYEWRKKQNSYNYKKSSYPEWTGEEDIKNKKILLYCEQGLGDTIQFARYCNEVKSLGAFVYLAIPKKLKPLLSLFHGIDEIIISEEQLPHVDFLCSLMSLPMAFRTTLETIPLNIPYIKLAPLESRINKWKKYIGNDGFKIAICWQGSKNYEEDNNRSFALDFFSHISKIDGVRLISLQKIVKDKNTDDAIKKLNIEVLPDDFDEMDNSFLDSACVMNCVDCAITSDTSLTHLAGALGVKTYLPLSYHADWRWLLNVNYSPWYKNHKIFRQQSRGDWDGVFKEIKKEITKLI